MFFLIRCVFWLSVVFSTIFSARSPAPPQHAGAQTLGQSAPSVDDLGQNWVGATLSFVKRQALEHCAETDCFSGKAAEHLVGGNLVVFRPRGVAQAEAPLPPRRPMFAPPKSQRSALEKSSRAEYVMGRIRRS